MLLILAAYSEWYNQIPADRWIARLRKTARAQLFIVLAALFCAALLRHEVPARHQIHIDLAELMTKSREIAHDTVATIDTLPAEPRAGEEATLILNLTDLKGQPVKELTDTHERLIHVIIVGEDLDSFTHIHPDDFGTVTKEMKKSSRFTLRYLFPKAGKYLAAVDTAIGNNPVSKIVSIKVSGSPLSGQIRKDMSHEKRFGNYTVSLSYKPEKIMAGEEVVLTYMVNKEGKPVTDLEPYLGAPMHLAVVGAEGKSFLHTHGELPGDEGSHHGHEHMDMMHMKPLPPHFGPEIHADIVFQEKGLYKIFGEIRHNGRIILLDFMVEAE